MCDVWRMNRSSGFLGKKFRRVIESRVARMLDSQLMQRFVSNEDSLAFRDLVARHGPAVLRVCRRFVHDPHAAEDAMQATFLILVQRAPSIREPEQLDRWLAGVARRVAARARRREVRRIDRERIWAETHSEISVEPEKPLQSEIRRAVREELDQLPTADQQPLTLCYIHGLTHEEAARQIGCPVGTIKARLVRARRRLRDRLDRRGVATSLGLLLFLLRRPTVVLGDEILFDSTAEAMDLVAVGNLTKLRALYPQTTSLIQSTLLLHTNSLRWISFAGVIGLLFLIGGGAVVAELVHERSESRKSAARLAKLLDVNCQETP